jgi:hypothetical protein
LAVDSAVVPQPPQYIYADDVDHRAAVRLIAKVMDTAFIIPGTKFRFGLDAILGLIPVFGDAVGALIGTYILYTAAKLGVPKVVLARMLLNIGTDAVVGAVPVAGDVLDAAWRANAKNAALLEQAMLEPRAARRSSGWLLFGIGLGVFALAAGGLALTYFLARFAWQHLAIS